MKTNKLVIVGSLVGFVLITALLVKGCSGSDSSPKTSTTSSSEAANVDGDQVANTLMALTAKYEENLKTNEDLARLNQEQAAKIEQLADALKVVGNKTKTNEQTARSAARDAELASNGLKNYDDKLAAMVRQSDAQKGGAPDGRQVVSGSPSGSSTSATGYLLDNIRSTASDLRGSRTGSDSQLTSSERFVWFSPTNRPDLMDPKSAGRNSAAGKAPKSDSAKADSPIKRYTINAEATAFDATAMTALIGRIPIGGTTPDPYRVKLIIGRDNLAANGYFFDHVDGMIVGGWAKGDWNLSCVNVELDSYAFVFDDGTIVDKASSSGAGESLGYISMPNGFPCVPGDFHTNAPAYLAQTSVLAGLQAAGEAYAQSQTSTEDLPLGGQRTTINSAGKYALGKTSSAAVEESIRWIRERQQGSFDAVVAPPGVAVSVHFTQQIKIDYDPNGRRVNHETASATSGHYLD